jgi:hypothetical protein
MIDDNDDNIFYKFHNWIKAQSDEDKSTFDPYIDDRLSLIKEKDILKEWPTGYNIWPQPNWDNSIIGVCGISGVCKGFLSQVVSCHPEFGGQDFYKEILKNYNENYFHWDNYTEKYNSKRIWKVHSDDMDIEDLPKFYKFVHISFDHKPAEIKKVQERFLYITNVRVHRHYNHTNLQMKANRIFQNYLRNDYKQYFEFPFLDFSDKHKFVDTCNNMFNYLEVEPLEIEILTNLFDGWTTAEKTYKTKFKKAALLLAKNK